jgi:hypothetical protein
LTKAEYQYVLDEDAIVETRFEGTQDPVTKLINYNQVSQEEHPYGTSLEYTLRPEMQYVWVEGQRKSQQTIITYIRDENWLRNIFYDFLGLDNVDVNADPQQAKELEDLLVLSETLELEGVMIVDENGVSRLAVPEYANNSAYSIAYKRHGDPRTAIDNSTLVRNPPFQVDFTNTPPYVNAFIPSDAKVYRYKGPTPVQGKALIDLTLTNYSDTALWEVTNQNAQNFEPNNIDRFDSSFRNRKVTTSDTEELDGNLFQTVKTVEEGVRDLYTNTLKASYPIGIQFGKSAAIPKITVSSHGGIVLAGHMEVPETAQIELLSTGGSILAREGITIFGASPNVIAQGRVDLIVEGDQGPIYVVAGGDIDLGVVSRDNLSSTLEIGTVSSTGGDVRIQAADGMQNFSSTSAIRGDRIELDVRSGRIGSSVSPLRIQSNLQGTGGLAALAQDTIWITQFQGDMPLIRTPFTIATASVESLEEDVFLTAEQGSILDGDDESRIERKNTGRRTSTKGLIQSGIASGVTSTNAFQFPVSPGLYQAIQPTVNFPNKPPVNPTERLNVKGEDVFLTALGTNGQVGQIGQNVAILNPTNYGALPKDQAELMSKANARDIVGIAYGLYRYLGPAQSNVNLSQENFSNPLRWQKLNATFATGADATATVTRTVANGARVRVEFNSKDYGLYEYLGNTSTMNLTTQNYADTNRWQKIIGVASNESTSFSLLNGALITNKSVIDAMTLRKTEDVNVDSSVTLRTTARKHVNLESPGRMPVSRVQAGNDIILRSGERIVDNGTDVAAIALGGNADLFANLAVSGSVVTSPFRTQVGTQGSLSVQVNGPANILQRSADTSVLGQDITVNSLFVANITAGGSVDVEVQEGNLLVGNITSSTDIDLLAPGAILDAYPSLPGLFVNVRTTPGAVPGHVTMTANEIGSELAPLTVDISGELTTQTIRNQWIHAATDLVARNMVSTMGSITVTGLADVLVGSIRALQGNVIVQTIGSILDVDGDAQADIEAISISLGASEGVIGAPEDDVEIDTANTEASRFSAIAQGHVYVTEKTGRLNVFDAQSTQRGDVRIVVSETSASGEDLIAVERGLIRAWDDHALRG